MNSISNDPSKGPLIEIAADYGRDVVGLAMRQAGMPKTADGRVRKAEALLRKCERADIARDRACVDSICMSVASSSEQGRELLIAVHRGKEELSARPLVASATSRSGSLTVGSSIERSSRCGSMPGSPVRSSIQPTRESLARSAPRELS
jgi:hypothetical protein